MVAKIQQSSVFKSGIYRHYKGYEYLAYAVAQHSETEEALVVYRCLYGDRSLWVRPLAMFNETVERDGEVLPRFELVKAIDKPEFYQ
ncbi:MAG: hypothetical protein ACI93R_000937 [Flavobacteriales bacterium]